MDNSQKRILVVDDEELLKDMLVLVLKDEGYQVDGAINGKEAWDLLNANNYDLLATDVYMPEMNGIDLTLKCQSDFPETRIILFCGGGRDLKAEHGQQVVSLSGQSVTVDKFLRKPCNLSEILSSVKGLLPE